MCVRSRSRWPCGLRRGFAAARFLGLQVRILPGAGMSLSLSLSLSLFLCCDCSVLSGAGLCDRPVNHPEESYLVGCVGVRSRNLDNEESLTH